MMTFKGPGRLKSTIGYDDDETRKLLANSELEHRNYSGPIQNDAQRGLRMS
jgi:hypothetical protein